MPNSTFASHPDYPAPGVVVELFAGVGGFRIGLEAPLSTGRQLWDVQWSNQWEPATKAQHASSCYVGNFGADGHVCEDISMYLDWAIDGADSIPVDSQVDLPARMDLLVGGFPCQDYSVAKPLGASAGITGKKGVLWWEIYRILENYDPQYVLLENVDRLLKTPPPQRGRDFAIILSCFSHLGYTVQWRVVNAADYGLPQRRRRVFILAEKNKARKSITEADAREVMLRSSVLAEALPVEGDIMNFLCFDEHLDDPHDATANFNAVGRSRVWGNAGVMVNGVAYTGDVTATHSGIHKTLLSVLQPEKSVPAEFYLDPAALKSWQYLKGAKKEPRTDKRTGHEYIYAEGGIRFPDPLNQPSRTILTSEGGSSPSRSRHVVQRTSRSRLRRLTPVELERLQGFPDNWTAVDEHGKTISDARRAFFMGNALVVGVVERIGAVLGERRLALRDTLLG